MRLWLSVVIVAALFLSAAHSSAQVTTAPAPAVQVAPAGGDLATAHELQARGLPANSDALAILFDPQGGETVLHGGTDGSGTLRLPLQPPGGAWQVGVYRVVVALPGGRAMSATFSATDGGRHLAVQPDLPSPTSALDITGVGLPPNAQLRLLLTIAGGLGQREISAVTDASGSFSTFVWPQAVGFDFFSAGRYELQAPQVGLDTGFFIREHPSTSFISLPSQIVPDADWRIDLNDYAVGRYIWLLSAGLGGQAGPEFLIGPTDARGSVEVYVHFPQLAPGTYALGSPYDWGETTFSVPEPTSTPTPMPTLTPTSTGTATATATATPRPTATATRKPRTGKACKSRKGHRKSCKP